MGIRDGDGAVEECGGRGEVHLFKTKGDSVVQLMKGNGKETLRSMTKTNWIRLFLEQY